ncbi:hypothetical protein [Streptosporangium sp. KLBMP 9127]|nr:hypothetical protein [Streptosporangium sp. KLBMP 9127]
MTGSASSPSRRTPPALRLAVCLLMIGGTAACSAEPPSPAPSAAPALSVTLEQARIDETKHVLSVAMRNDGPGSVHVERLQLVAPPLRTLPPAPVDTEVKPTPRVDLRLEYGRASCAGDAIPEPGPAHVLAWIREAGGTRRIRLPLPHPSTLLRRLVRLDCGAEVVLRTAEVRLGTRWRREGDALRGTVVIERRAPGAVTLQDLGGSVIFNLTPVGRRKPPLAVLDPGRTRLVVPVRFKAVHCTPHALAEAKKPYGFTHWTGLADLEPQFIPFEVTPEMRALLDDLVTDTCLGEGGEEQGGG